MDQDEYVYLMLIGFGDPLEAHTVFLDAFTELEHAGSMSGADIEAARDLVDPEFANDEVRTINMFSMRRRFSPDLRSIVVRTPSPIDREQMETLLSVKAENTDDLRKFLSSAKVNV